VSLQSAVGQLAAHWRMANLGYDTAASRIPDLSGNGNHLPKLAGSPTFGTYGGFAGMQMLGDNYYGGKAAVPYLPSAFTLVAAVFTNGLAGAYAWLQAEERDNTDPDWENFSAAFGAGSIAAASFRMSTDNLGNVVMGNLGGGGIGTTAPNNAWSIYQFVVHPDTSTVRGRVGSGAWLVANVNDGLYGLPYRYNDLRLGYRSSNTGAGSFAMAQMMLFDGDAVHENATAYAALISALMADPTAS
jgi:hypothetical protein